MATYAELLSIATGPTGDVLRNQVRVAVIVAAEVVRQETPATPNHNNRLIWARAAMANPDTAAAQMLWAVLAQNRSLTVAQITGATDATIQASASTAIDLLSGG